MENPQRKCADHGKMILDRHSDEKVNSAQIFGKHPPPTCLIDVRILGRFTFESWILLDEQKVLTKQRSDKSSHVE